MASDDEDELAALRQQRNARLGIQHVRLCLKLHRAMAVIRVQCCVSRECNGVPV